MAYLGDYPDDPFGGYGQPPAGYHYDENGNLVPDGAPAAPTASAPPLTPDQLGNAGQGFESQWNEAGTAPTTAPAGYYWDPVYATYRLIQPTSGGESGGGGGGGGGFSSGGGSIGSFISPFTGSAPAVPSGTGYLPPTPEFRAPGYTKPPPFSFGEFKAPTGETVLNEPGFAFGLQQGLQGLEQSAAARGVLNGGGTLKDVAAWAQNYGGQKYGDAFNREATTYGMNRANAADTYNRNYQSQYLDPYQFAFQGAQAEFAPKMQGYATQAAAGQRANEFGYGAAYDQYRDQYQQYLDNQQLLFNYRRPFFD